MKRVAGKHAASALPFLLAICFLLSSCGILGPGRAASGMKKAVSLYLDEIQDGTFADNEYKSEYAADTPFADVEFADENSREIMDEGLRQISYKISSVRISGREGACDVTVTAVDLGSILSDLGDDAFDRETLMDDVSDRKAPVTDCNVTLEMTYDPSSKSWVVGDSGPLFEILGEPYAELVFGSVYGDPVAAIDLFLNALSQGDEATINAISPYYDSTYFFTDDADLKPVLEAFYSRASYVLAEDPEMYDTYADVYVTLTVPDLSAIVDEIGSSTDMLAGLMKPYLYAYIMGQDTTDAEAELMRNFYAAVSARIISPDAPVVSTDDYFSLEGNDSTKSWNMYSIPSVLYDFYIDPVSDLADEDYAAASAAALDMLLQDGTIDQATHDYYTATINGGTPVASPADDIYFEGWWDDISQSYVTYYDSSTATSIEYDIEFYSAWPGVTLYYDWYNQNAATLCYSDYETLETGDDFVSPGLTWNSGDLMPADTYELIVYMEDGTIIADQRVTVY